MKNEVLALQIMNSIYVRKDGDRKSIDFLQNQEISAKRSWTVFQTSKINTEIKLEWKNILMLEEVNFTEKEKSSRKIESLTYEVLINFKKQSFPGPFSSAE